MSLLTGVFFFAVIPVADVIRISTGKCLRICLVLEPELGLAFSVSPAL